MSSSHLFVQDRRDQRRVGCPVPVQLQMEKAVNMRRLSNKVAIVTGASKGIGGGIATAFGAAGARVAVNYSSDREGAERVVRRSPTTAARRSRSGPTCPRPQMSRGYSKKWMLRSADWTFWSTTPGYSASAH